MWVVAYIISISILLIGIVDYLISKKRRTNIIHCIGYLFLSITTLYFPSELGDSGNIINALITSFLETVGALQGNVYQLNGQIDNINFQFVYVLTIRIVQLLLVFLGFSSIFAYIFGFANYIEILFQRNRKTYVFIELNKKTENIINSIHDRSRIIILNVQNTKQKKGNNIVYSLNYNLSKFLSNKMLINKKCALELYLFGNEDVDNLAQLDLIGDLLKKQIYHINIYIELNELSWYMQDKLVEKYRSENVKINFIRIYENFALNMLYKENLYNKFSVSNEQVCLRPLFIGLGKCNLEIIKCMLTIGQMPNCSIKVLIVENDINVVRNFKYNYPELFNIKNEYGDAVYDIQFIDDDFITSDMTEIDTCDMTSNYTVAFIDYKEDIDNINMAQKLTQYNAVNCKNNDIAIYIRCKNRHSYIDLYSDSYKIMADFECLYAIDNIKTSFIENVAKKIHEVRNKNKSFEEYNNNEYKRRAIYNRTLCLKYKIWLIDKIFEQNYNLLAMDEKFAIAEHMRWNTFVRGAGFRYGNCKDLSKGVHTDLIRFDKLSEKKKQYDYISVTDEIVNLLKDYYI